MTREERAVRFLILGPLEIEAMGASHRAITAPAARKLLLLLLLHHDSTITTDQIGEALWPDRDPTRQSSAMRFHIWKLRTSLEPFRQHRDGGTMIIRNGPGYMLTLGDHWLDAEQFAKTVGEARRPAGKDALDCLGTLQLALQLWRGTPLADAQYDDFAQAEIRRLTTLRLEAQMMMMDLLIETGQSGLAAAELEALTARHPLSDRLWIQLMTALLTAGRATEALAVFDRAATILETEFNLGPAETLLNVRAQIVAQYARSGG